MTTLATLSASYHANRSYRENGSTTEAEAFVSACRGLLIEFPQKSRKSGLGETTELEFDLTLIRDEMQRAESWIAQQHSASSPSVTYPDFGVFR